MKSNTSSEMKKKYKKVMQLVKEVVDQWDPIGLLAFGCPPDEYNMEIECIVGIVAKDIDVDTLAVQINAIFQKFFGSDTFKRDFDECLKIAKTLNRKLQDEGLIEANINI